MLRTRDRAPSRSASHPELLALVERPARYAGGEYGAVRRPDPAALAGTCCLVFPDVYEVGMSHFGLRILAAEVNAEPDLCAERAFAPWPDLAAALRASRTPLWALESGRPVRDFDVVGITLPHELAAATVLGTLELAGLPLRAADRADRDPVVLGGGTWASHPAALEPYFDALFVGDGEGALPGLVREVGEARRRGVPRRALLERLGERPEILIPALRGTEAPGARAVQRRLRELPDSQPYASGPIPGPAAVFDRVTLEIARGCGGGCRFCQAGYVYRPERTRGVDAVLAEAAASLRHTGYDELSLTSLSTADYPRLGELLERLAPSCAGRTVALGVSSLRAYGLPESALRVLAHTRRTGLTLAPEAGTQRLRDVISKSVGEVDLLEGVRRIAAAGWRRVKLYFMLGLPTETDQDLHGLIDLVQRVVSAGRSAGRGVFQANVSLSTFVPKPHTPFQWEAMPPLEELRRRQELLRRRLRSRTVEVAVHDARGSTLEALLGRGDARAADAVLAAHRAGAYLDAWTEHFSWDRWQAALAEAGIDLGEAARPSDPAAPTPWDHVRTGIAPAFLLRERERAYAARPTPRCDPSPERYLCVACGLDCPPPPTPAPVAAQEPSSAVLPAAPVAGDVSVPDAAEQGPPAAPSLLSGTAAAVAAPAPLTWWRLVLRKSGPAVWLGHLDFVRAVVRAMRRAGLPPAYSRGFHPQPRLVVGAPLPLGLLGLAEPADVQFEAPPDDPAAWPARLTARAHEGVEFLELRAMGEANPRLGRALDAAEYLVAAPGRSEADARQRAAAASAAERLVVRDPRREAWSERDARPALLAVEPVDVAERLGTLAPPDVCWGLRLVLPVQGCPPLAAFGALLLEAVPGSVTAGRVALLDANRVPLR
ncbi:MAG: TIGR03960 family B12-binding radical SAM protein [Deltaproteobacteria bacterium]|nr:TIGR03960 family B12-binding radical SAM protein [Deltaproteobacteria bacterium]